MAPTKPAVFLSFLYFIRIGLIFMTLAPKEQYLWKSLLSQDVFSPEEKDLESNAQFLYYSSDGEVAKKSFDKKWIGHLARFKLVNRPNISDEEVIHSTPAFVTAFSDNHFKEAELFLQQFQKLLISENIQSYSFYLYDLGIKRSRLKLLKRKYNFLTIRHFPFDVFPLHVYRLFQYRWKPLIIADVLKTHSSLWWMDSSTRISSIKNLTDIYDDLRACYRSNKIHDCDQYPITFVDPTGHSIFATTDPKMFDFLPMTKSNAVKTQMMGASVFVVFATRKVIYDVMIWWVLCALETDCLAPAGSQRFCKFGPKEDDRWTKYASCHRFDQAALNILVASATGFQLDRYKRVGQNLFTIERMS